MKVFRHCPKKKFERIDKRRISDTVKIVENNIIIGVAAQAIDQKDKIAFYLMQFKYRAGLKAKINLFIQKRACRRKKIVPKRKQIVVAFVERKPCSVFKTSFNKKRREQCRLAHACRSLYENSTHLIAQLELLKQGAANNIIPPRTGHFQFCRKKKRLLFLLGVSVHG